MGNWFSGKHDSEDNRPEKCLENPIGSSNAQNSSTTPTQIAQKACFGAGCYWGTEKYFSKQFKKKSENGRILRGQVGFMGTVDSPKNPSYEEVCSGMTGHVEVYDFDFSGTSQFYEDLVKYFFQFHNPTTLNQQGNDKGTQYASVIFCYDDQQFEIATRVKKELQNLIDCGKVNCFGTFGVSVTTDIRRVTEFYPAHQKHQDYLSKNPKGYCNHRIRFENWPE